VRTLSDANIPPPYSFCYEFSTDQSVKKEKTREIPGLILKNMPVGR
jgi:hypothetical protein